MSIRTLHVVDSLEPEAGCVATLLPGLWTALTANDVEVKVLAGKTPGASLETGSIEIVCAADPEQLQKAVAGADLVHIHGVRTPLSNAAAKSALSRSVPYIVSPYGELSGNPQQKPTFRQRLGDAFGANRLLKNAAALHVVSHREAEHLPEAGHHARVIRAPLGLSSEDGNPADAHVDPLADHPHLANRRPMLYLGPLTHPLEGLIPWLKACGQLADDMADWHVVLAGPAHRAWRAVIEAGLRRGGATERATIIESPSLAAQRGLLHRAELVVSPSVRDNVPVSVMQALAAGVPVIASDRLYLDDLDDLAAVHVTVPNRKKLVNAMSEVVDQSPEDRQSQARAAQTAVAKRFDWAQRIPAYLAMYRSVAKG